MIPPWKVQVDWTCHEHYGSPVDIELHVMGKDPKVIHREPTTTDAVAWAVRFFTGRGFGYLCDIDRHQRCNHTYIVMHPQPRQEQPA